MLTKDLINVPLHGACLCLSINYVGEHYSETCKLLLSALPVNTWKVQLSILSTLQTVFDR